MSVSDSKPEINRMEWLQNVALDPRMSHGAVRLAVILGTRYINNESGMAWPSQATLASDVGATDRSVRTWVSELETRGYIVVHGGRGRNISNTYWLRKPEAGFRFSTQKTGNVLPVLDEKRKTSATKPENSCTKTGSRLPMNLSKNLSNNLSKEERARIEESDPALVATSGALKRQQEATKRVPFPGWREPADDRAVEQCLARIRKGFSGERPWREVLRDMTFGNHIIDEAHRRYDLEMRGQNAA